ncbi:Ig-like domain-containing protein [Flavobacteriales bacterium]|nr:Ig-like domain-containing protein [Flavobacteriales bacterium]
MKKVIGIVVVLSMFGCAQQVAPTGGPKDVTPPEVFSEAPANRSTDFTAQEVVISFDEFIQFKNPSEQIVISPPMLKSPTYQLKKKSLVINFEQQLAINTTYTINFGEAIRDNNEGNILKNYTYVFSTGAHLDSMQVKGKLTDALSGEAIENALVMLYKQNIDSLPLDTIPNYFTQSLADGSFHIQNISDQPYKVFALKDENSNYKFDVPEEQIGFLDSLISPFIPPIAVIPDSLQADSIQEKQVATPIPNYEMRMFIEEDTAQFLKKSYCDYFGKLVFVYNRPVGKFNANFDGVVFKNQWALKEFSNNRDSITLWITGVVPDTMTLIIDADYALTDTVELVMKPRENEIESASKSKRNAKGRSVGKFVLTANSIPPKGRSPKPDMPLTINWNHPIIGTELSNLKLYEDSVRVMYDIVTTDTALRKFDIQYPWKKDAGYQLLILDSAFTDMYGLWNDTVDISFIGTDKKSLGELSLNITETPQSQIVIEVHNPSKAIVHKRVVNEKGIVQFAGLDPGKYAIRITKDLSQNGVWDSGRYSLKLQPEPIKTIEREAEVRANWDLELEWNPNE